MPTPIPGWSRILVLILLLGLSSIQIPIPENSRRLLPIPSVLLISIPRFATDTFILNHTEILYLYQKIPTLIPEILW